MLPLSSGYLASGGGGNKIIEKLEIDQYLQAIPKTCKCNNALFQIFYDCVILHGYLSLGFHTRLPLIL